MKNSTLIPDLTDNQQTEIMLCWTPMAEKTYNVGIKAIPVSGETRTANNWLEGSIYVSAEADIRISPNSFDLTVLTGEILQENITIKNLGLGELHYNISRSASFYDDVEEGVGEWTTTALNGTSDLWHITSSDYNSASHAWWCAAETDGDYDFGRISNGLISPSFELTGGSPSLHFWEIYETEPDYDSCMVQISSNGGMSWSTLRSGATGNSSGWVETKIDLTSYVNQAIQLRFHFETGDDIINNYTGWKIDDIRFEGIDSGESTWLFLEPDNGIVAPTSEENVTLTANASLLNAGVYHTNLSLISNDPDEPIIIIPVNLTVLEPPVADAGQDIVVDQHTTVTLNGTGSSDDLGVVNWSWIFTYDGEEAILYGAIQKFTFHIAGHYALTLSVKDGDGNEDTDAMNVTVLDITKPAADAGPDRFVVLGDVVVFDGSGSKDNVGICNYSWFMVYDSQPIEIYGVAAQFTFHILGIYVVTLHVTDDAGNWDWDTHTITVVATDSPTADAGEDIFMDQHSTAYFNGSSSWDNIGIAEYNWSFRYNEHMQYMSGMTPNHTFHDCGIFNVSLNVTDTNGNWDVDHVMVIVRDTTPPHVDAGEDMFVEKGEKVIFDSTGSWDNVLIIDYNWAFVYGGENVVLHGPGPSFIFRISGIYSVTLTATDGTGNIGTDTVQVEVNDTDSILPITDFSPNSGTTGDIYRFNVSGIGGIEYLKVYVNWSHGVLKGNLSLTEAGKYWLGEITLDHDIGDLEYTIWTIDFFIYYNSSNTRSVTVFDNDMPIANAGRDQSIPENTVIVLDGIHSTDNIKIVHYHWSFIYNMSEISFSEPNISFNFDIPGNYTITLTVRDGMGNSGKDQVNVRVLSQDSADTGEVDDDDEDKGQGTADLFSYGRGISIAGILVIIIIGLLVVIRRRSTEKEESVSRGKTNRKADGWDDEDEEDGWIDDEGEDEWIIDEREDEWDDDGAVFQTRISRYARNFDDEFDLEWGYSPVACRFSAKLKLLGQWET